MSNSYVFSDFTGQRSVQSTYQESAPERPHIRLSTRLDGCIRVDQLGCHPPRTPTQASHGSRRTLRHLAFGFRLREGWIVFEEGGKTEVCEKRCAEVRDQDICLAPIIRENERRRAIETHSFEIAVDDFA